MKCPACSRKLTEMKVGSVLLDVCQGGCGGIWFDARELQQLGQSVLAGETSTIEIQRDESIVLAAIEGRDCVRCPGGRLEHKLFSLGTGVIMDCCPQCGGVWLDYGELETIREETHPQPRPVRHVIRQESSSRSLQVSFEVVQQVQHLRIRQQTKAR